MMNCREKEKKKKKKQLYRAIALQVTSFRLPEMQVQL